jgi:hypothetical protein
MIDRSDGMEPALPFPEQYQSAAEKLAVLRAKAGLKANMVWLMGPLSLQRVRHDPYRGREDRPCGYLGAFAFRN